MRIKSIAKGKNNAIMERKFFVGDIKVIVSHNIKNGYTIFNTEKYSGAGNMFAIMGILERLMEEENISKIAFSAAGMNKKEVLIKEELYKRILTRMGYALTENEGEYFKSKNIKSTYQGPLRTYILPVNKAE